MHKLDFLSRHKPRWKIALTATSIIFAVGLLLWARASAAPTRLSAEVFTPPFVYQGREEARELVRRVPQLETSLALTLSSDLDLSRTWLTETAARTYTLPDHGMHPDEAKAVFPRGLLLAAIHIRKNGQRYTLLVRGSLPLTPSSTAANQSDRGISSFLWSNGRWLAMAADEADTTEILHIVSQTPTADLPKALNRVNSEALLRGF